MFGHFPATNMAPPPQYRLAPRRNISDGCAKWVGVLCLTTDKCGPKLDMLNYSSTYIPRVSFVEKTPFASDKSSLKLVALTFLSVGQREALPTGCLSQALEHVKCCKNNAYDQFEQLTPPKYMAQSYDQDSTADRS